MASALTFTILLKISYGGQVATIIDYQSPTLADAVPKNPFIFGDFLYPQMSSQEKTNIFTERKTGSKKWSYGNVRHHNGKRKNRKQCYLSLKTIGKNSLPIFPWKKTVKTPRFKYSD